MMGYTVLLEREHLVGDLRGLGVLDLCVLFNCFFFFLFIPPDFLPLILLQTKINLPTDESWGILKTSTIY